MFKANSNKTDHKALVSGVKLFGNLAAVSNPRNLRPTFQSWQRTTQLDHSATTARSQQYGLKRYICWTVFRQLAFIKAKQGCVSARQKHDGTCNCQKVQNPRTLDSWQLLFSNPDNSERSFLGFLRSCRSFWNLELSSWIMDPSLQWWSEAQSSALKLGILKGYSLYVSVVVSVEGLEKLAHLRSERLLPTKSTDEVEEDLERHSSFCDVTPHRAFPFVMVVGGQCIGLGRARVWEKETQAPQQEVLVTCN